MRLLLSATLFVLAGCGQPGAFGAENTAAYVAATVYTTVYWGGIMGGKSSIPMGVAIVERATGAVSFCRSECVSIGDIGAVTAGGIEIHAGGGGQFLILNSTSGPIATCEVKLEDGYSGSCAIPAKTQQSAAVAEDKAEDPQTLVKATAFVGQSFADCGGSHLTHLRRYKNDDGYILEYKNISFVTKPNKVTAADRLNGIDWKGSVKLVAEAYREKGHEWADVADANSTFTTFNVERRNGRFNLREGASLEKLSCELPRQK
jgi:hypothetical protein